MKARWVLQDRVLGDDDSKNIIQSIQESGSEHIIVRVKPFSSELPPIPIDDRRNIYYGSTTFIDRARERFNSPIGVFLNDNFSMKNYFNQWGSHMLNSDAIFMTAGQFIAQATDDIVFVRPDGDGKEFDGIVDAGTRIADKIRREIEYNNRLTIDSQILIGPAYSIQREWRNYVVDGRVVTSSMYRKNFQLNKQHGAPEDVVRFVEDRCREYTPHSIFAMDVAEVRHDDGSISLYIIECGCMNSVGLYHADIHRLVREITNWVARQD